MEIPGFTNLSGFLTAGRFHPRLENAHLHVYRRVFRRTSGGKTRTLPILCSSALQIGITADSVPAADAPTDHFRLSVCQSRPADRSGSRLEDDPGIGLGQFLFSIHHDSPVVSLLSGDLLCSRLSSEPPFTITSGEAPSLNFDCQSDRHPRIQSAPVDSSRLGSRRFTSPGPVDSRSGISP